METHKQEFDESKQGDSLRYVEYLFGRTL